MQRMPTVYAPHGGGPWPWMTEGAFGSTASLRAWLAALPSTLPARPRAALVVTAHWEESAPTVSSSPSPPMLYDYYGFPPETYQVVWPAPGEPSLAAEVRQRLTDAGFPSGEDPSRGFDHGTFVPMAVAWPGADLPTVQLSLVAGLDPALHLAIGRALAPLRDDGVLILGSGMSYHNMRGFRTPAGKQAAETFDGWLAQAVTASSAAREAALVRWADAPGGRASHPREEHLLPLMVAAGAALSDAGRVVYRDQVLGVPVSGVQFG